MHSPFGHWAKFLCELKFGHAQEAYIRAGQAWAIDHFMNGSSAEQNYQPDMSDHSDYEVSDVANHITIISTQSFALPNAYE